jgi:acyl-CoA thioesterase I
MRWSEARKRKVGRSYGRLKRLVHAAGTLAAVGALSVGPAEALEPPRVVHVFALGDSLTAGFGLPRRQGFAPQLEAHLRRHGVPARVINAGVSGDTAAQGLQRLDWTLNGLEAPPQLAIVALGANDMLRGLPPRETRDALDAILTRLNALAQPPRLVIAGMRAAPNLGPDYGAEYEAVFRDLADEHEAILYPFFLDGVAGERALNQADGIHPNFAGVKVMVGRITPVIAGAVGGR